MKGMRFKLWDGCFTMAESDCFKVESNVPILCYEEHGIYNVISNPERGNTGETVIHVPRGVEFEYVDIDISDCAFTACALNAGNVSIKARSSACEFDTVRARRMAVDFSRGALCITAKPLVSARLCCGFGNMKLRLAGNEEDYRITAQKGGGGMIRIASQIQMSNAVIGSGTRQVMLRCGLGEIDVNWI